MADGERAEQLGEIIRRQRELSALSMRQFADLVGISNPYLSQIERGLRDPSEKVLEGIAESLQISVDTLREQAGIGGERRGGARRPSIDAIRADPQLTGRQRQAMLEIYAAFTASAGRGARTRRSSGSCGASRVPPTAPGSPLRLRRGAALPARAAGSTGSGECSSAAAIIGGQWSRSASGP